MRPGRRVARAGEPAHRGSARRVRSAAADKARRTSPPRRDTSSTSSPPGAPSQVDTWDPKPELTKLHGQSLPGLNGVAMASPFKFARHGQSGIEVSEVFPAIAQARGRTGGHPLDADRHPGARSRAGVHEHRLAAHGQAEHRRVGALRARQREPEHARLHLAAPRRRRTAAMRSTGARRSCPATCRRRASTRRRRPSKG